jgi:hypothetical protein
MEARYIFLIGLEIKMIPTWPLVAVSGAFRILENAQRACAMLRLEHLEKK